MSPNVPFFAFFEVTQGTFPHSANWLTAQKSQKTRQNPPKSAKKGHCNFFGSINLTQSRILAGFFLTLELKRQMLSPR
jgi:hypothetical protein